jgi:hypothetical protein
LYDQPPALLIVEIEHLHSGLLGRLLISGLDKAEQMGARPEDGPAPTPKLGGGALLFYWRRHSAHGPLIGHLLDTLPTA